MLRDLFAYMVGKTTKKSKAIITEVKILATPKWEYGWCDQEGNFRGLGNALFPKQHGGDMNVCLCLRLNFKEYTGFS